MINVRRVFALLRAPSFARFTAGALLLAGVATPASAVTFSVTNGASSGPGSLREAIINLNGAGAGAHTINFDFPPGTVGLVNDLDPILGVGQTITINGNNHTVDGASQVSLFFVGGGNVAINDLTLANGQAVGGNGGGMLGGGGGGGALGAGGALFVNDGAAVTISNVTFTGNSALGGVGGSTDFNAFVGGGGGAGFRRGGGATGAYESGGGGGGYLGNGGLGDSNPAIGGGGGGGGGGLVLNGGDASTGTGGAGGGAEGGDGGVRDFAGDPGLAYGGGGGGGRGSDGGAGGDFGGGGGGGGASPTSGIPSTAGNGGFGGGGGGIANDGANSGAGGFGGGNGGAGNFVGGNGGNALGGAIFVRDGGSLTIVDSGISGSSLASGAGGGGLNGNGVAGTTDGAGLYLHGGVEVEVEVTAGALTWGDQISGEGGLCKMGAGTLNLNAANNYTGLTEVCEGRLNINGMNAGEVIIQAGSTLGGTGEIQADVTNNGTLAPGNSIGTLTVSNFTSGANSAIEVEVNEGGTTPGTNVDLLAVAGNAMVGGTVNVVASGTNYTAGSQYTFLTAMSVNGTFTSITDNLAFLDAVLGYTSFSAYFTLVQETNYADAATTINTFNVGTYLDGISAGATGDLEVLLDELNQVSDADASFALEQLTGAIYGSLPQVGVQNTSIYVQTLARRLRSNLYDGDALAAAAWQPTSFDTASTGGERASTGVEQASIGASDSLVIRGQGVSRQWNTWGSAFGMGGSAQSDGNAAALDASMGGSLVGMETLSGPHLLGFYGGYLGNYISTDANESAKINGGTFGTYYVGRNENQYLIAAGGLEFDDYETRRQIAFANSTAQGDGDGWKGYSYLERGMTFGGPRLSFQPFAGAQYVYVRQNGLTETGAAAANLAVPGIDAHSLRSVVGSRLFGTGLTRGGHTIMPELRALWLHEFLDTNSDFTTFFSQVGGGPAFTVNGLGLGRDWAMLGAGLNTDLGAGWSAYADYDLLVNDRQTFHIGSGGLQYVW